MWGSGLIWVSAPRGRGDIPARLETSVDVSLGQAVTDIPVGLGEELNVFLQCSCPTLIGVGLRMSGSELTQGRGCPGSVLMRAVLRQTLLQGVCGPVNAPHWDSLDFTLCCISRLVRHVFRLLSL